MNALDGIRILDLTRLLPGPFASLVLADLGAQVDKLEDVGAGDYMRHTPPVVGEMGAGFHALNRGKRSLALDLKRPEGVAAVKRLLPHYDVLFEQFRPGVLARLGLGHDVLRSEFPKLIVCALTGYGQTGPLAGRAGHDINYMARAGLLGLQGPAGDRPQVPAFQLADVSGGLWCVIAIQAALAERQRTGQGKVIDIAMLDSVLPFATVTLSRMFGGETPERGNELLTGGIAPYDTYLTKDGACLSVGALEPKFLMKLGAMLNVDLDMSALLPGPHQKDLRARLAARFAEKTRDEWMELFSDSDVCVEPILTAGELKEDPQLQARQAFFSIPTEEGTVGGYRTPVTPRDLSAGKAPRQGQHSDAILGEAGFSSTEIGQLRETGVVR